MLQGKRVGCSIGVFRKPQGKRGRWLRKKIPIPSGKPKFMAVYASLPDGREGQCFLIVELTPENVQRIIRSTITAGKVPMRVGAVTLEFDAGTANFEVLQGMDAEDCEEYADNLGRLINGEDAYVLLDEHPEFMTESGDVEWDLLTHDDLPRLRCDVETPTAAWEVVLEGGRIVTSRDLDVGHLWRMLGSAQPFYFSSPKRTPSFHPLKGSEWSHS